MEADEVREGEKSGIFNFGRIFLEQEDSGVPLLGVRGANAGVDELVEMMTGRRALGGR